MREEEVLEKVHKINYLLLNEMKRVCDENGIQYFLDSGALLGAVRHQDFIPWDDDVDISFLRSDYEKFIQIASECLKSDFKLVMPGEICGEAFFDFTPKVVYIPSRVDQNSNEQVFYGNSLNHVSVDLFVIDKLPKSFLKRIIQKFKLTIIYGMAMGHRYKLNYSKYRLLEKIIIFFLQKYGSKITIKKLVKKYDDISCMYMECDSDEVFFSNYGIPYLKCTFKADWFDKTLKGKMNGDDYTIPKEYDKVLRIVYGNYMELPPIEDRTPRHIKLEHFSIT